jgi:hypothetical protein
MQVPSGVFVFLNDIDFVPTPTLHSELTVGRWKSELQRMRSAFFESQIRETLVLPAFERLGSHGKATPWHEPCEVSAGCEMVRNIALPRTFDMLRHMLQTVNVVDVFHRPHVRSAFSSDKQSCSIDLSVAIQEIQVLIANCTCHQHLTAVLSRSFPWVMAATPGSHGFKMRIQRTLCPWSIHIRASRMSLH